MHGGGGKRKKGNRGVAEGTQSAKEMLITAQLSRISLIYRLLRDAEAAFLSLEIAGDLPSLLCFMELMSFLKETWKTIAKSTF